MTRRTPIVTLILAAMGSISLAGDLNPPAGPVAATMKDLAEVEPRIAISAANTPGDASSLFKITQSGSYYLTGNITGIVGNHGIAIAANGVTLDLNGFDLSGVAGTFDGITTFGAPLERLEVRNGSIGAFGDRGVDLSGSGAVVSDVRVRDCTSHGIRVGEAVLITRCTSSGNQGSGIVCGASSVVDICTVRSNTLNGIDAADGATIRGCAAAANGSVGILTGQGSSVSHCSAYGNTGGGISTANGCTVSNCSAHSNTGSGINTGNASSVSNCSADSNTANGIDVDNGCTVVDCAARTNTLNGIHCFLACVIRANTCSNNGNGGDGAGINATGNDTRIEGNNCSGSDRGIDVDAFGNFIVRNTCSGNGVNWTIAANNVCGPILDRSAPASAAINGNTAPDSTGSTHPNANFTY